MLYGYVFLACMVLFYFYQFWDTYYTSCNTGSDNLCASCRNDGCFECHRGFVNIGKCKEYTHSIDFCVSYNYSSQCDKCLLGYSLNRNEIGNLHCSQIFKKEIITQKEFEAAGMSINISRVYNQCEIENCNICSYEFWSGNKGCHECKKGYSLFTNNLKTNHCQKQQGLLLGCRKAMFGFCQSCEYGYYVASYKSYYDNAGRELNYMICERNSNYDMGMRFQVQMNKIDS